jgi:putative sterol carrier protein
VEGMNEGEKENLFFTFQQTIDSIIIDKKKNPKNEKLLNNFKAKINLGLQIDEDDYLWLNLLGENGNYSLNRGKLEEFDLELKASPEDLLFFSNGENSIMNMMMKRNSFGERKLRFSKGSSGKRNLGKLLKLSKILVLD